MANISIGLGSFTETSIAVAATCDIGALTTLRARLTVGSPSISSFGPSTNRIRFVRTDVAVTLVNSAALSVQGGADISIAAGSTFWAFSDADGDWFACSFSSGSGEAVGPGVSMLQFRLALADGGDTATAYGGLGDLGTEARDRWEAATRVEITDALALSVKASLGLTDPQLADLFALAATL